MGRPTCSRPASRHVPSPSRLTAVEPFVLVPSPLLGPASWARVAAVLPDAIVPDLRELVAVPRPPWAWLERAVRDLPHGAVVVGHSGAGALLPIIGAALDASGLVFVDAGLPPATGTHRTPDELRSALGDLAVDGILPPWPTWSGEEALRSLLPDEADRAALDADARPVPLAFYDEPVPVPDSWTSRPCGYVRLSEAYDSDAEEAGIRGWPVVRIAGHHLEALTRPAEVARAIRLTRARLRWAPSFRPLTHDDVPVLHRWVNTPHVAQWWDDLPTVDDVAADVGPSLDGHDPTAYFVIELDGRPVGMIQTYLIDDDPDYAEAIGMPERAAGVDLLIGEPDLIGRGLGPAVLHAFTTEVVFRRWPPGIIDRCVAGPDHRNIRSIAAFESAGYVRGALVRVPTSSEPEQLMVFERV
jgi:RimJ/RimL family protein N-acetyltransferase